MSEITLFCQKCGEGNEGNLSYCTYCDALLEKPSEDFLKEVPREAPAPFNFKTLIPGIKAGAMAGVISGLIFGLYRFVLLSMLTNGSCIKIFHIAIGGIFLLVPYIIFNVLFGAVTGGSLSFFSVVHDMSLSRITSMVVNIIIALVFTLPLSLLQSVGAVSTLPLFIGVVKSVISGAIGGAIFSFTIPLIYQQYFRNK